MMYDSTPAVNDQSDIVERPAVATVARWIVVLGLMAGVGFIWPVPLSEMTDPLGGHATLIVTLTALVAAGAISGYVLRSRLTLPLVPLALYLGGFLRWLAGDWRSPEWDVFLAASAGMLGVLTITAGVSALVASQVVGIESRPFDPEGRGIRVAAALSVFLALVAAAVSFALPFGVFGAIFAIGAILAGLSVLEEDEQTRTERTLAFAGIVLGGLIALWDLFELGMLIYRFL